jgi:hypothetical protein
MQQTGQARRTTRNPQRQIRIKYGVDDERMRASGVQVVYGTVQAEGGAQLVQELLFLSIDRDTLKMLYKHNLHKLAVTRHLYKHKIHKLAVARHL